MSIEREISYCEYIHASMLRAMDVSEASGRFLNLAFILSRYSFIGVPLQQIRLELLQEAL